MLSPLILQTTLIITESHILSDKSDHTSSHPVVGGAGGEGEEDGQTIKTIYNLDSSRSPRAESCPSIGCLPHCLTIHTKHNAEPADNKYPRYHCHDTNAPPLYTLLRLDYNYTTILQLFNIITEVSSSHYSTPCCNIDHCVQVPRTSYLHHLHHFHYLHRHRS